MFSISESNKLLSEENTVPEHSFELETRQGNENVDNPKRSAHVDIITNVKGELVSLGS